MAVSNLIDCCFNDWVLEFVRDMVVKFIEEGAAKLIFDFLSPVLSPVSKLVTTPTKIEVSLLDFPLIVLERRGRWCDRKWSRRRGCRPFMVVVEVPWHKKRDGGQTQ